MGGDIGLPEVIRLEPFIRYFLHWCSHIPNKANHKEDDSYLRCCYLIEMLCYITEMLCYIKHDMAAGAGLALCGDYGKAFLHL